MDDPSMALASARKRARFSEVSANLRAGSASGTRARRASSPPFLSAPPAAKAGGGGGFIGARPMEGALAGEGAPEGHGGEHERGGGRLALAEPEGRPHERRDGEEIDRIVPRPSQEDGPEHELAHRDQREKEGAALDQLGGFPARPGFPR